MRKSILISSAIGLLAPMLLTTSAITAASIQGGEVQQAASSQVTANSTQSSQAVYVGKSTSRVAGNASIVNVSNGKAEHAWGFDQDVANTFDPLYANNNGAGTSAVGQVPYPIYQDQGDLVTALTHHGLPLAQINSVVAAMLLADNGTYRGDFTPIPGVSSDEQANIYNAQVQSVLDVIVGQADPRQAEYIKSHFTPFQQKLYNAAEADKNLSVSDMTTAYLVSPGSNQQITKLQLNLQNNETPRFELNPHYLGSPVNVNQIVPSGYQVIDNATGQPVSELQPGHVYYVKATHPTNQATVALDYDKDSFNYFSTNSKLPLVFNEVIGDGPIGAGPIGGVNSSSSSNTNSNSNTDQKTVQVYYDDNGNYVGPLQSVNGMPIIHILDDAGLNNIVTAQHMYDQNNAIRVPNSYYEGLMSSTPMLQDLTLLVFANMEPVQSSPSQSSSSNIAVQPQRVSSALGKKAPLILSRTASGRSGGVTFTGKKEIINGSNSVMIGGMAASKNSGTTSSRLSPRHNSQLPDTGDGNGIVLVFGGLIILAAAVIVGIQFKQD